MLSLRDHAAPRDVWRLHTQTQETDSGFGEDDHGKVEDGNHDQQRDDLRQEMAHHDAPVAGAADVRRLDERGRPEAQRFAADNPGIAIPAHDAEQQDEIEDRRADEIEEEDCQQQ